MAHPLDVPTLLDRRYPHVLTSQHESIAINHLLSDSPPHPPSLPRFPYASGDLANNSVEHITSTSSEHLTKVSHDDSACSMSQYDLKDSCASNKEQSSQFLPNLNATDQAVHHSGRRKFSVIGYRRLAIVILTCLLIILAAVIIIFTVHLKRAPQLSDIIGGSDGDLASQSGLGSARNASSLLLNELELFNGTTLYRKLGPDDGKRGGSDGYDSLIVFGASYCDNAHTRPAKLHRTLKPPPYYKGRWTNGYVWNEYLSAIIGPGGRQTVLVNYAFGGASVDNDLNQAYVPDLKQQVSAFLSDVNTQSPGAGPSDGKSLIATWIGLNNVIKIWKAFLKDSVQAHSQSQTQEAMAKAVFKINAAVDDMFGVLQDVIRTSPFKNVPPDFLLLPIPPADLLPVNVREAKGNLNALQVLMDLSASFNDRFANQLQNFRRKLLPGQEAFSLDIPNIWRKFIDQPGFAELTIVDRACVGHSGVCKSPESYLYWDTLHPTTHIHQQLALMINTVIKA